MTGLITGSNQPLKIEPIEPGTYEEYTLDENEKVNFIKKTRFHSIGTFPKYDVDVNLTGKSNFLLDKLFNENDLTYLR